MSGFSVRMQSMYCSFERVWNPTEVKNWMLFSVLPTGGVTAGVRLGARRVGMEEGRAVNVWSGVDLRAGHWRMGGVPFTCFSMTVSCQ